MWLSAKIKALTISDDDESCNKKQRADKQSTLLLSLNTSLPVTGESHPIDRKRCLVSASVRLYPRLPHAWPKLVMKTGARQRVVRPDRHTNCPCRLPSTIHMMMVA